MESFDDVTMLEAKDCQQQFIQLQRHGGSSDMYITIFGIANEMDDMKEYQHTAMHTAAERTGRRNDALQNLASTYLTSHASPDHRNATPEKRIMSPDQSADKKTGTYD